MKTRQVTAGAALSVALGLVIGLGLGATAGAQEQGGPKPDAAAPAAQPPPEAGGKETGGAKAGPADTVATTAPSGGAEAPYTVADGNMVDPNTYKGWQTWRAMACERCHGPNQEGLVGPSLVNSLKTLTKDQFKTTLMNGRPAKGMPNFGGVKTVVDNLDNLYAYLKGRSDGAIKPGHLHPIAAK